MRFHQIKILSFVGFILTLLQSTHLFAAVPKQLEPEYCEALIHFGQKNYSQALSRLDRLLSTGPGSTVPEFYEIKALIYKDQKNDFATEVTYRKLLEVESGKPEKQAPYAFELGSILFQKEKYQESAPLFYLSAKQKFNEAASWFYYGLAQTKVNQKSSALAAFENAIDSPSQIDEIRVGAQFYAAQLAAEIGYATSAYSNFTDTQVTAKKIQKKNDLEKNTAKAMQSLIAGSKNAQKGFNRKLFFGSLGISTIYDSNVLALPVSVPDLRGTGKDTYKGQLTGSFGYSSSPINSLQFVGSYRGNTVYHTNRESKTGEFMPHSLSLFINYKPLNRVSGGVKFQGLYLFQNNPETADQNIKYEPFQAQGVASLFVRVDLRRGIVLNAEAGAGKAHFFGDKFTAFSARRSGSIAQYRFSIERDLRDRWFNPSAAFGYIRNKTIGTEFDSGSLQITLTNSFNFGLNRLTASFDFMNTEYSAREAGFRDDTVKTGGLTFSRPLLNRVTLTLDARYTHSSSTVPDLAEFRRFVGTTSLTLAL